MVKNRTIIIIDYSMGNIRSISNKIKKLGFEAIVTADRELINKAEKIILPGVGHFGNGIRRLKERNLIDVLNKKVINEKTPILGICLGMQLFTRFSEEGNTEGLGWLDAETVKFTLNNVRYKVPHMGWNSLAKKKESLLLNDLLLDNQFYFVHSYHLKCFKHEDILTTTFYGYEFISAVQRDNIFGTQFHPEKSREPGEKMLHNFLSI